MKLKMLTPWKNSYDQPTQHIRKKRHYFANKGPCSRSYGFSSSHVWMWELDHKERWAPKIWCFWTVELEKTLESPLDCKEIQPVRNQSWIFTGRTDAEAETPILWPPDVKNWLIWKDPDAGKDWGQEEKVTTEDEMLGWHHRLDGHEFEKAPAVGDGQGSLAVLQSIGSQTVEHNWVTEMNWTIMAWIPRAHIYVLSGNFFNHLLIFMFCLFAERNWKWKSLSCFWLFASPWTIQSMEFSRPEYWSG